MSESGHSDLGGIIAMHSDTKRRYKSIKRVNEEMAKVLVLDPRRY